MPLYKRWLWVYVGTFVEVPKKKLKAISLLPKSFTFGILKVNLPTKNTYDLVEYIPETLLLERMNVVWVLKGSTIIYKNIFPCFYWNLSYDYAGLVCEKMIYTEQLQIHIERISTKTLELRKNTLWVQKGTAKKLDLSLFSLIEYSQFDNHGNAFKALVKNEKGDIICFAERIDKKIFAVRSQSVWVRVGTTIPIPLKDLINLEYLDDANTISSRALLKLENSPLPIFISLEPKTLLLGSRKWVYQDSKKTELESKWYLDPNFFPEAECLYDGKHFRKVQQSKKRSSSTDYEDLALGEIPKLKKPCFFAIPRELPSYESSKVAGTPNSFLSKSTDSIF